MQITLKIEGLETVKKQLAALSSTQTTQACAKAINDTAFQVRRAMQAEITRVFDRPTPYILRSPKFTSATPENLTSVVSPTVSPTYYGGKGIDPQKILKAQADGGRRRDKRSEVALRRVGILPNGYQTAAPTNPYPGTVDAYGNIKGSTITQLISYFQAFGEQGYRANASARTIKNLATKGTKTQAARRYFVAYGKLRGGKTGGFAPGIWAASGPGGVDVRPVLMFVKAGKYQKRLDMERVAQAADAENYLSKRLRYRIRQAYEAMGS